MPKELTLTRLLRVAGHGVGSTGTCSLALSKGTKIEMLISDASMIYLLRLNLLFGLGSRKWTFGGIVSFSNARTHLMTLVIPEAPSEWPTFGFTYPRLIKVRMLYCSSKHSLHPCICRLC